jgi:putative PIN family toxin of toxin-antitoxin system
MTLIADRAINTPASAFPVVIDTNIVLDLLVFKDARTGPLKTALAARQVQWLATQAMRDELERVLDYPQIAQRRVFYALSAAQVLQGFDAQAQILDAAPKATVVCKDPDDQKFIDLAVQRQALLLSKDRAVLCLRKRLLAGVLSAWAAI